MLSFLEKTGFVYVFENSKTNKVKVGMTSVSIESRLKPLNREFGDTTYLNGDKNLPLSFWQFKIAYITKDYSDVEALSHKYLKEYLDENSPIGEVFSCSILDAEEAIVIALKDLNLFDEANRISGWEEYLQKK